MLFCCLPYRWFMANRKQYALNRMTIYTIYGLSILFPFFLITDSTDSGSVIAAVTSGLPQSTVLNSDHLPSDARISIWEILLIGYAVGVMCVSLLYLYGIAKILLIIRKSDRIREDSRNIAVINDDNPAPFSWCNTIVMSRSLYESDGKLMIMAHESAHISLLHWIDLLIAQVVICFQWFNPAAWMLRDCLKEVHEFQADECVLNEGVNPRRYQLFVVSAAFSSQFNLPVDFFNAGNIRKRICMMNSAKPTGNKRLYVLAILPFLSIGIFACTLPSVMVLTRQFHAITFHLPDNPANKSVKSDLRYLDPVKATSGIDSATKQESEQREFIAAEYIGGQEALMLFMMKNLQYPKAAEENCKQGKVTVSLEVSAEGDVVSVRIDKSIDPYLDEEALRVCRKITKLKPATLNGSPVASVYQLPINFKLS